MAIAAEVDPRKGSRVERSVVAGLAGLAVAVWLSATACGASAPWGSAAETSAPPPRVSTASPPSASPTPTGPATATPTSPTAQVPTTPTTPTAPAGPAVAVPGGNAVQGHEAIQRYGCGSCHIIPGVPGANGRVGPSLAGFAERKTVAGVVPNTPENLVRWLQNPQAVKPGTAMPNLGVTEADARNIAAYLYTLR